MSELFKKLMEQIDMPLEMRQSSAFSSADIREVKVHSVSRLWEFYFSFAEILPIEIYRELAYRLVNTFKQADITATFDIQAEKIDFSQPLLQAYYEEAFEYAPCDSASFKASFSKLKVSYDGEKILIAAPAFVNNDHFRKNHLPNLARQFEAFGFGKVMVDMVSDEAMTQALREDFTNNREAMVEKVVQENREAVKSLEASIPPAEEAPKPKLDFKERAKQRRAGFENAEITPMVEITTEENRIVFEGMVFDVEKKTTRTGRHIINFKMTDYTSSFAMQKWAKDDEELKKCDMIAKGSWLRVRGNIENNNFTHALTMNVQDVKEIIHHDRKDLMPEDQKRVEFHAHTNMSTMDALPTVEELIDTAAKWGHKAVAITDHGNVQSFPHGYHRARKDGIKAIFGLEANIVEDKVPIAYNPVDLELNEATYVVFDVETTGLSAVHNDLIQIAASKMYKGNIVEQFDEFINPGHHLSAFTTELTGITDNHVRNAKPIEQVLQMFQDFCKDTVLVAHNATFDVGFMNVNYKRHDMPTITQPVIDTLELARNLYPEYKRHGLGPLTKRFQVSLEHHHMANYDAEATGRLLFIFLKEARENHGLTNMMDLNTKLVAEDSYKKARVKHATIYVQNQTGLKNIFKLVSLSNVKYFEGVARIPRTVLDAHREGLLLGTACSEGEVFDAVLTSGVEKAVEVAKYYDFIEVMPPAIYAPLLVQGTIKDEEGIRQVIRDLIEVGRRVNKPVLATGNVHYIEPEDEIYREIIVRSLGQGAPINRPIGRGEDAQPAPLPKAHFRTTNEMLDEFSFLGEDLAYEIVVKNTSDFAERFEEIEVVKKDLYTPFLEKSEERVAEMTYQKAFEIYGNPLPDIVDRRIEKIS